MSLETTFTASLNLITRLLDQEVLSQPADEQLLDLSLHYKNGTGEGAVNNSYNAQLTIAASDTTTLNLYDGSLLNTLNLPVEFTILKVIAIQNLGPGKLYVNGASGTIQLTNGVTDSIIINAGGFLILANGIEDTIGYPVTDTNSNLVLTADSTTGGVVINVLALGE